ncbi:hypothetical protein HDU96_003411, partial [Phlyctochytrium bullatum]
MRYRNAVNLRTKLGQGIKGSKERGLFEFHQNEHSTVKVVRLAHTFIMACIRAKDTNPFHLLGSEQENIERLSTLSGDPEAPSRPQRARVEEEGSDYIGLDRIWHHQPGEAWMTPFKREIVGLFVGLLRQKFRLTAGIEENPIISQTKSLIQSEEEILLFIDACLINGSMFQQLINTHGSLNAIATQEVRAPTCVPEGQDGVYLIKNSRVSKEDIVKTFEYLKGHVHSL